MTASLQLDHVVIAVRDLEQAVRDYEALGFTVTPGGEHPGWGSRNALVPFADGSYLELIAFAAMGGKIVPKPVRAAELAAEGRSAVECRVLSWASAGEGFVDFAVVPVPLDEVLTRARQAGLRLEGPFPGGRVRPDGRQVDWQFAVPERFDLPFLCADVTPRDLRVPGGAARRHANGATGVASLSVAVTDLPASVAHYRALFGTEPHAESDSMSSGARVADFGLGPVSLMLAEPVGEKGSSDPDLQARGEGPRSLWLRTTEQGKEGKLDPRRTHGAAIQLLGGDDAYTPRLL